MLRRRTLPVLAVLATLAMLAGGGCRMRRLVTTAYLPYVAVGGTPRKIKPGSGAVIGGGVHLSWLAERRGEAPEVGGELAWSHHEAAPGRPEADYFRLGAKATFTRYWGEKYWGEAPVAFGGDFSFGLKLHYLMVDGPGDVAGIGPSGSAALHLRLGREAYLAAGVDLDLWLSTEGGLAATFAPFVRFGMRF